MTVGWWLSGTGPISQMYSSVPAPCLRVPSGAEALRLIVLREWHVEPHSFHVHRAQPPLMRQTQAGRCQAGLD